MNTLRYARTSIHKKQERMSMKQGVPTLAELEEDTPILRKTSDGIVSYIKNKNVLYKNIYEIAKRSEKTPFIPTTENVATGGYVTLGSIILQWGYGDYDIDGDYTVTFANEGGITFPNSCFGVFVNHKDYTGSGESGSSTSGYPISVKSYFANRFIMNRDDDASATINYNYLAIGN